MKILLINPPSENEIRTQVTRFISGESSMQPPLGLLYIAAYMIDKGHNDTYVLDCQGEGISYSALSDKIANIQPDIVGITAMTFTMVDVVKTATTVKETCPKAQIVLGGPHVDIYPKETIKLDNVDYAIRGEGEIPFFQLVHAIEQGNRAFHRVPNLIWIANESQCMINHVRTELNDYDLLPFPAREINPIENYYSIMTANNPVTSLMTAKGCPYSCIFCYHPDKKVKHRSPASVADEMEQIKKMGIREVFFVDDTFYVNPKIAMDVCQKLIERNVGLPWGARARVNIISDKMLTFFKKAGCKRLHIGVESGNQNVLNALDKKITIEQIERAFKLCHKHKMKTLAYFIIGSPGETRKEIEDTIKLVKRIKPDYVQFSRMTPMPSTKLYEEGLKNGVLTHDYWLEFAKDPQKPIHPQLWTENFSEEELLDLTDHATMRFYLRPSYFLKSIAEIKTTKDFMQKAKVGINMVKAKLRTNLSD